MEKVMNMKKFIYLLFALILTVSLLTACAEPNLDTQTTSTVPATLQTTTPTQPQLTTAPTQPTTVPTQPTDPGIELEIQWSFSATVRTLDGPTGIKRWPVIIKSLDDLRELFKTDLCVGDQFLESLQDVYDGAFFEENTLIVFYYHAYHDYNMMGAVQCLKTEAGYYYISTGLTKPKAGDGWPGDQLFFIEVKADIPKNAIIYIDLVQGYAKQLFD